ncbi:CoA-binding protein [Allopusillimonas soli]|uniref:Acetate--CoA ligase family protein n=1 Tax=Allopusillimonas soli TaxID=659016 RepID=A0A853FBG9_9BURK|nr:acetate--CoA ligase family protein [Allopusillimonas soli]NYT37269.1 acetate--CoA ligase family protein [Allopusillimonas soli]TEA74736.1 CoA-binding protein [Allopusillimonas soli]
MSANRRKVYRRTELERLFAPRSVAIVGVSPKASAFGSRTLDIIENSGFTGRVHAVNAKYDRIGARPCYPSIRALPETPDCVVIALPREGVEPLVRECADCGVGGVIIYSSGYSETGKAGRAEQQAALTGIARESGMRILGPNCIGILNHTIGFHASFIAVPEGPLPKPRREAIGLVSQSGALGFALSQASERGISFSHMLTCGNACDVDVADEISFLADDPGCRVIACVFEGMSDPHRLIEAAEIARDAGKPVVIYKMATGAQGAEAAMSHTGSLAGSNAAYQAAFRRAGIIMVEDFEALVESAAFFAKAGRPAAPGVAVVATSGGACIMAADKAERHRVPLPQPLPATREVLEQIVPEFGSPRNPCDVTAQVISSAESLQVCVDALMDDDTFGALVVPQPLSYALAAGRLAVFSAAARRQRKIACAIWLTEWLEGPGVLEMEADDHVALFRSMDRCFAALAAWNERESRLSMPARTVPRLADSGAEAAAMRLLADAGSDVLTEREAKQVLKRYGVPVVEDRLVQSADAAAASATELGYPVVMKVESPDILHKTDAGVVRLNLENEQDVRAAFEAIMENARRVTPMPRIQGVLVQPMVRAGTEIMVGAKIDPLFGPVIVVGLGGIMVELLKDTVLELAPVNHGEALGMLGRLKGKAALGGFRGSEPVDLDGLADIVCRLSELVSDQQSRISEMDVNPLICSGGKIMAVDALIVRRKA